MDVLNKLLAPVGRSFLALIFIIAGFSKIPGYTGTQGYMEMMGVPGWLLPLVIVVELGGGIALLLGWRARPSAFLLAGFTVLSGILFHLVPSFGMEGMEQQAQMTSFLKNLAIAGGLDYVFLHGAGNWSLDRKSAV